MSIKLSKGGGSLSNRGSGGDVTPASLQREALRRREAHLAAIQARKAAQAAWYAHKYGAMHPDEFYEVNRTSERHKAKTVTGRGVLVLVIIAGLCGWAGYILAQIVGAMQ